MAGEGYRRRGGGEERFYCPPAMREKYNQQQQRKYNQEQQQQVIKNNVYDNKGKTKGTSVGSSEKIVDSDDVPSASKAVSVYPSLDSENETNLDRFLQHTTPTVIAQQFPKTSTRGWKSSNDEFHPYFLLDDLWESFGEWSAYGAGVPLVLNGSECVVQYYVPYLSGIQLYIDPSKPFMGQKRPIDESDADSSRETSSDSSNEGMKRGTNSTPGTWRIQNTMGAAIQGFNSLSIGNNNSLGLSTDEGEIRNPPGLLIFEYFEQESPYTREPLADKISVLASRFPEIKTLRSFDLTPASWISVAWYPIYRIPTGPTLQNLDACFLTYHSLSTPLRSTSNEWRHRISRISTGMLDSGMPMKLSLPIFGLASYKFKISVWESDALYECQKVNSLSRAAENWLRLLQVNHPDYSFFMSRGVYRR